MPYRQTNATEIVVVTTALTPNGLQQGTVLLQLKVMAAIPHIISDKFGEK